MKKFTKLFAAVLSALVIAINLTACGDDDKNNNDANNASPNNETKTIIKVGVCAGPYEDMFNEAIEPTLIEKGYKVEYVQFSDYVQPNLALAEGEINLNIFQHSVYLKNFSEEHNLDLKLIAEIPTAGMGVFSNEIKDLSNVPNGAKVAIPNDPTNLSRAIRVLEQAGLIKIDETVDPAEATQFTLSENSKNIEFIEIEAPQLPRSLDSVALAVINGNYALGAGLNLSDALFNEVLQDGYVNVIAVRTEDFNADFAKDTVAVVHSDAFRAVIEDASKQYASFYRPSDYNS